MVVMTDEQRSYMLMKWTCIQSWILLLLEMDERNRILDSSGQLMYR